MRKLAVLFIIIVMLCGCSKQDNLSVDSISEINGEKIGCMSGSIFDKLIEETFPD